MLIVTPVPCCDGHHGPHLRWSSHLLKRPAYRQQVEGVRNQPILSHRSEQKLEPGAIVPLEIEIWPSGTRFEAGEKLRLVVQGTDIYTYPKPVMSDRHEDSVNRGHHVLYTGGRYDSHLLIPDVPQKSG